ncbi:hypothetical protein [Streptomyces melanogenes]|uniref:hypothetical protein n=1 Tax=Streptomyces melanogenes TaxID=67326 RepID=UPI00167CB952|nr:hypothetical protein [Streptomyces melanogenes]GGP89371.1 hypothetical protein GCM10010278_79790 [Streptomyces melanogenes]
MRKISAATALAAGLMLAAAGTAVADDCATVNGGDGFSQSPNIIQSPQQGVLISNGSLVDGRCIAPWSNGAVAGGVVAPNSHYAACNTAPIDQSQNAPARNNIL